MRDLIARLFHRRRSAPRSAGDVALRLRVYGDAMRYARARETARAAAETTAEVAPEIYPLVAALYGAPFAAAAYHRHRLRFDGPLMLVVDDDRTPRDAETI